jgi:glycosyltransferase involved in cell wall biosynthesis
MYPFVLLGRIINRLLPLKKEYRIFFFFPFYHIGGAEKVHYQIAQAVGGPDCIIFFTKKSHNQAFLKYFKASGCEIIDISRWTDNKWFYFLNLIYRGIITTCINKQKQKPVVFNGQCNFGYKISPWVKKEIRQIELIHSFNSFSYIRTPFLPFISTTVMISQKRIDDHLKHYLTIKPPLMFAERIEFIPNAIPIPEMAGEKEYSAFTVLYAGRESREKRLHLVGAVFKLIHEKDPSVKFEILGDVSEVMNQDKFPFVSFHGNVDDESMIGHIFAKASVLLLTSSTEGFPLVIMEAMAHGCAIISTPVGDISYHVKDGINGYLFSSVTDEDLILKEGVGKITELKNNPSLLKNISGNNIKYAKENFDIGKFNLAYRRLFEEEK